MMAPESHVGSFKESVGHILGYTRLKSIEGYVGYAGFRGT